MAKQTLTIGIIGGSGLGDTFATEARAAVHEVDTPFGRPSGPITVVDWSGVEVCLLQRHGPGHLLNPTAVPYRANIYAMKSLGVTHLLASGATGSLREGIHPGELVVVDQVVDKTTRRANTFYEDAAVHVEFSEPFCPVMRRWLLAAAERAEPPHGANTVVHDRGTYVCMEGPAFSTRAESAWHRQLGGDLIGMTAMPEARLAREAEIAYALIAMPTDYDSWKPRASKHAPESESSPEPSAEQPPAHPLEAGPAPSAEEGMSLLEEIIGNLHKATAANLALIKAALRDLTILRENPSPAHDALALGIWSDKAQLDPREVERLGVLWGRHF
ncbi:MAG: MTAP family purine nucleoside phosphorylase [Planctomycetota bacterium]